MTDSSGNIRARYAYDPYGRRTKVSGDMDADFGFTGYYVHQPSGLQFALYRAYDSDLGRFINRDPMGEDGGINLYDYVGNDPINFFDPLGLWGLIAGVGGNADAGVDAAGVGVTVSAGVGGFYNQQVGGFSGGAFASGGATANWGHHVASAPSAPNCDNRVIGAYAGGGVFVGLTNAKNVQDLSGPFKTYSFNIGWGPANLSIQFSIGQNAAGQEIWSFNYGGPLGFPSGGGFGGAASKYNTYTATYPK